jgi:hypothetical protein
MTELPDQVAAAYDALAAALEPLDEPAWDTPSRCEGWRIRELVAHLTMPARYDGPAYLAELEAAGGDFTALSNTIADRDAALPTTTLTAQLREPGLQQWVPPGGGVHQRFGVALPDRLEATDLDWSHGPDTAPGEPVRATAGELVMLLTGRARPA